MIKQILIGIGGIIAGFCLTYYTPKLIQTFGLMGPVEAALGSGRTYLAIRAIGAVIMVIFFMYLTGILDNFVLGIFGVFAGR